MTEKLTRTPPSDWPRFKFKAMILIVLLSSLLLFYSYVDCHLDFINGSKGPRSRSRSLSNGQRICNMTFTTAICPPIPVDKVIYKNWTYLERGDFETQLSQTLVLIKSMALMSKFYKVKGQVQDQDPLTTDCIEFIIFSDSNATFNQLESVLSEDESWRRVYRHLVHLTYTPVIYPKGFEDFYSMYKPCATVKTFLPQMLPKLTSVLYLDTDTIFLTNPKKIWSEFNEFSEKNWARMVREHYTFAGHGYREFYGESGLNSGVILLNLTRMRESQFMSQIRLIVAKFWKVIRSDQDIFNIYFHYHPEEMKLLNCSQNFFQTSCRIELNCRNPEIEILHGAWKTFITEDRNPIFRGIFGCFNKTTLSEINSTIFLHNTLTECIDKMTLPTHNFLCSGLLKTKNIIHIKAN